MEFYLELSHASSIPVRVTMEMEEGTTSRSDPAFWLRWGGGCQVRRSDLRSIFEGATPRADVLSGELRGEIFAASLAAVVGGTAEGVYQDPAAFFANTFPTVGLKSLLTEAFGRIAGRPAAPVIRLETAFGGGKTHSLIALYHMAVHEARPLGVADYVDPALLPDGPVRVAVAVGTSPDLAEGTDRSGFRTHTLWGEIAAQLGAYDHVASADRERTAPGTSSLQGVFAGGPVIVLLDELARYLEVAAAVRVGDSTLADQTTAFLMALFEYAAEVDHLVVAYSLASSADAFVGQTEKVLDRVQALKEAAAIGARLEHVISPTGENEIAAIVRHRLFERVDPSAGRQVAAAYHVAIVGEIDANRDLPSHAARAGYARDLEESYPFHPELLLGLNEKVSTIPNFQKTRGALRLLARVVRGLWAERPSETWMIHPHHIDLSDEEIAADLTSRLDRAVFQQVIEADIANPMAGAKAHAVLVDDRLTRVGKPAFATRMATTVFLHSLVQGVAAGLTPTEAKLAVFTPGDDVGLIEKQTNALLDQAFFLHFDGIRYRFSTEPSLAAVVNQERALVGRAAAKAEIDRRIRTIWKKGAFEPVFFPAEPSDVEDTLGRPKLVVLHYDAVGISDETAPAPPPPPTVIGRLFDRAGTSDGFRTYRNHVLFLVADTGGVHHAVEEARRYLAVGRIIGDPQRYSQFTRDHRKRLKGMADQAELTLRIAITRLYRHLLYPDNTPSSSAKHHHLNHLVLPAQDQGNVNQNQSQVVLRVLRELGKVRTADDKGIPPVFVRQRAWPANADRATPRQLQKEFASRVNLPVLLDINILKETVKLGIKASQWVYFDPAKQCAYSNESPTSPLVEITDDVELIVPEAAEGVSICGRQDPGPPPVGMCPVCGNPQNACTCNVDIAPLPGQLRGEGSPAQAFQRVADLAQDRQISHVATVEIRAAGTGRELRHDLQAMALAVPQLPKGDKRLEVKGTFDLPGGDRLAIEFDGSWNRYRQLSDAVQKAAKDAQSGTGHITLRLTFPSPVEPAGSEIGNMCDTFARISPGHVEVVATPGPDT